MHGFACVQVKGNAAFVACVHRLCVGCHGLCVQLCFCVVAPECAGGGLRTIHLFILFVGRAQGCAHGLGCAQDVVRKVMCSVSVVFLCVQALKCSVKQGLP